MFFFLDLTAALEEALERPEEPEEVFCTFAMARMLAEALPHVNAGGRWATNGLRAVFDSLNRRGAVAKITFQKMALLLDTGSSLFHQREHGGALACSAGVCYKFEM